MNPIEEIDRLAELRRGEIAEMAARAEELPAKIAVADEKVSAAAEAGDRGAFEIASRELDTLKREQEFIRIRLNKLRTSAAVDPDRITAAWNEYRTRYDVRMEKAIAEFEKARRKMLDAYSAMVELQTESSTIRKRFGAYDGTVATSLTARFPAKMIPLSNVSMQSVGLLSMGGTILKDPDAVYYLSDYVKNSADTKPGYFVHTDRQLTKLNGVIGAGTIPD